MDRAGTGAFHARLTPIPRSEFRDGGAVTLARHLSPDPFFVARPIPPGKGRPGVSVFTTTEQAEFPSPWKVSHLVWGNESCIRRPTNRFPREGRRPRIRRTPTIGHRLSPPLFHTRPSDRPRPLASECRGEHLQTVGAECHDQDKARHVRHHQCRVTAALDEVCNVEFLRRLHALNPAPREVFHQPSAAHPAPKDIRVADRRVAGPPDPCRH